LGETAGYFPRLVNEILGARSCELSRRFADFFAETRPQISRRAVAGKNVSVARPAAKTNGTNTLTARSETRKINHRTQPGSHLLCVNRTWAESFSDRLPREKKKEINNRPTCGERGYLVGVVRAWIFLRFIFPAGFFDAGFVASSASRANTFLIEDSYKWLAGGSSVESSSMERR
jgi:hypothetical protein